MKKNKIIFIPVGGLANRMRSIDSAIAFAKQLKKPLEIIWFKDWGMKCAYNQLFEPIYSSDITIREAIWKDKFLFDRPRKKNFWLPYFFQLIYFDKRVYENDFDSQSNFQIEAAPYKNYRRIFIAGCYSFYHVDNPLTTFMPLSDLQTQINSIAETFSSNTIGVHIRGTDNCIAVQNSPVELFIKRMEEEIQKNKNVSFYLATDSQEVKSNMLKRFPNRLKTTEVELRRNSLTGIKMALIELYVLSKTNSIIGSFNSSYTQIASQLSGIKLEILKK